MTYLVNETKYQELMRGFIEKSVNVDTFIQGYFAQWRSDRDAQWDSIRAGNKVSGEESDLGKVLDQAFTACDCYKLEPQGTLEIGEEAFRMEITSLFETRWGAKKRSNH
jgi:hypothetical protein